MTPDDPTLAQLVRRLADPVIVADRDGIIVFWNDAAERVFGWTAHHAIGMSLDLIIPDRQGGAGRPGQSNVRRTGPRAPQPGHGSLRRR
jgi:PAS domain S-box-containing protein